MPVSCRKRGRAKLLASLPNPKRNACIRITFSNELPGRTKRDGTEYGARRGRGSKPVQPAAFYENCTTRSSCSECSGEICYFHLAINGRYFISNTRPVARDRNLAEVNFSRGSSIFSNYPATGSRKTRKRRLSNSESLATSFFDYRWNIFQTREFRVFDTGYAELGKFVCWCSLHVIEIRK